MSVWPPTLTRYQVIPLPYLFIDARTSVSDIQTVAQLARILWGGGGGEGGLSKIRACPYFGKCRNLRTVPKAKIRRFGMEKISVAVGLELGWPHRNRLLQNLGRDLNR